MSEDYFDYQEVEEEEDLNFAQLIKCSNCHQSVPEDALFCLYCGEKINKSTYSKWIIITAIVAAFLFLTLLIF